VTSISDMDRTRGHDGDEAPSELVLRHAFGDWFSVERADYRRIQWASIEGTAAEMLALADALEAFVVRGERETFTGENGRCRIVFESDRFGLSSPRNSMGDPSWFPIEAGAALALSIREETAKERPAAPEFGEDDGS
jgi:hypothetical protein